MSASENVSRRRPELQRSIAAALYYYPPKAFFAHDALTAQVTEWDGGPVQEIRDESYIKGRLARRITSQLAGKLPFDNKVEASDLILMTPKSVAYEPAPLTFVCPKCRRMKEFRNLEQIRRPADLQCPHCEGHQLSQLSYVLIHQCGTVQWLTAPQCKCGSHMDRFVKVDPRDMGTWEYQCPSCGEKEKVLPAMCPTCRTWDKSPYHDDLEMQLKPCTGSGIVVAQHETFVDFPGKAARPSDQVLAEHMGYRQAATAATQMSDAQVDALIPILRMQGMSEPQIQETVARLRPAQGDWQQRLQDVFGSDEVQDLAEKRVHDYTDILHGESTIAYEGQLPISQRLGVAAFHYVGNLHVVDTVYGYLVGARQPKDGTLNLFKADSRHKQVLVNRNQTEGILITFDRQWLMRLMAREGALDADAKALLPLMHDDPNLRAHFVQAQAGEPDPDAPEEDELHPTPEQWVVRKYIHTLAHLLMKTATIYTGIGLEGLSELIFPEIPAVLIYAADKNNLGGMRTLYDTKVKEWLEYSREAGQNCMNDPRCTTLDNGACYACVHVPEVSCRLWNTFLDRRLLMGGSSV